MQISINQANNSASISDFEQIYIDHKDRIYTFLLNILNYNVDDASQILADTFVKLREYGQKNKIQNLKNLAYTISHNLAVDFIKKNKNLTRLDDNGWHSYFDLLDNVNLTFEQKRVQEAIFTLDTTVREVVQLTYYEDKSYQEISEILSIPKNTIWTMLFQAKKKLERIL